ncbi:uncharacterized protein [Eurosta solidaginis]|uniref:uncharacterized protein n=1 Tax=Eurosta solidaginis TaxID=178769 RepID=UPI0035314EB9
MSKLEDWTVNFIKVVESKPALYNHNLKEQYDGKTLDTLWLEVGQAVVPSWNCLTANAKKAKAKELEQKWRNIRKTFRRELILQKFGQSHKKRRKYRYANQLSFLLPTFDDISIADDGPNDEEIDEDKMFLLSLVPTLKKITDKEKIDAKIDILSTLKKWPNYSPTIPYFLRYAYVEENYEEIDEDKMFLLSLVPTLKKIAGNEKIGVKKDILSTLST